MSATGIYHDYPIPAASSKAQCYILGCENVASVLLVIRTPHRWLFDRPKWGEPDKTVSYAPGSMTISVCRQCARQIAEPDA